MKVLKSFCYSSSIIAVVVSVISISVWPLPSIAFIDTHQFDSRFNDRPLEFVDDDSYEPLNSFIPSRLITETNNNYSRAVSEIELFHNNDINNNNDNNSSLFNSREVFNSRLIN